MVLRDHSLLFPNKSVFLSLKIVLSIANSVDPDEKPDHATFHLGLHCLSNTCNAFRSH